MSKWRDKWRHWRRTVPLRRRVSMLTSVAVALAVAVTGIAGYVSIRVSLYRALDNELIGVAHAITAPVSRDVSNLGGLTGQDLRAGNVSVALVRTDGTVFYVRDEPRHMVTGPEELAIARMQRGTSARSGVATDGAEFRIVAVPVTELGNYALVLGRPLEATNRSLSSLWVALISFGGLGVILAGLVGATVARSALRPVRRLTEAVEHVSATDDLRPIAVTGNDELSRLAHSFNRMLRSVASSRERQKQLIADAGHELRTPLTSLRTNIELLEADRKSGMLTPADREDILRDVSAQLAEFTTLIGDLVQLARDDQVAASPEPIDLRTVVQAALDRARRRGPGLIFDVELNPFYLVGESDTLERAITNLLDNAVKFSPPGGTVRVQLEGDQLRIADQGPGIADEDLPHIFDRFYRSDKARNTPGTGLGLSIAAQAIARHGGWIRAGRSAQGGAEFTLWLPGSATPEEVGD